MSDAIKLKLIENLITQEALDVIQATIENWVAATEEECSNIEVDSPNEVEKILMCKILLVEWTRILKGVVAGQTGVVKAELDLRSKLLNTLEEEVIKKQIEREETVH